MDREQSAFDLGAREEHFHFRSANRKSENFFSRATLLRAVCHFATGVVMRCFALAMIVVGASAMCAAQNKKLAEYPLRVHIFRRNETTFYHMRVAEAAKGEGRANLFENGEPRGMDFQFDCAEQLQTSSGFETFPAKWKKPNQELEVLMPEFGKPDKYDKCKLKRQT